MASLLADRLATKGVDRIVGPAELGAEPLAEPAPEVVRAWAGQAEVGTVVVGRTTRLGRSLSIDVRLLSGDDGEAVATFVEEVARPADLGGAVERLAERVLEDVAPERASEPVASSEPADSDETRSDRESPFRGSDPIQISAAQLEAFEEEGRKRLVFTDDVRASQGAFELRAARLEAFYPAKSSQPERLVASGDVRLSQEGRAARCDTATYYRADQRVVCAGKNAVLEQDEDQLRGREITFHLDSQVLYVTGGATVRIESDGGPLLEPRP